MKILQQCVNLENISYLNAHAGQTFRLADVSFTVLSTHEDAVNTSTGQVKEPEDFNATSLILKITIDGKTFMMVGDLTNKVSISLYRRYSAETLKSDIAQLAHHGFNNVGEFMSRVAPEILLVPQSEGGIYSEHASADGQFSVKACLNANPDLIRYYAGSGTVGLQVIDGKIEKVYEKDVDGGSSESVQNLWSSILNRLPQDPPALIEQKETEAQ